MDTEIKEYVTFKVLRNDQWCFVTKVDRYSSFVYSQFVEQAAQVKVPNTVDDRIEIEHIVTTYKKLLSENGITKVQLVKVKITTQTEQISLDETPYIEERRDRALAKLTNEEALALGLDDLLVLKRLKS